MAVSLGNFTKWLPATIPAAGPTPGAAAAEASAPLVAPDGFETVHPVFLNQAGQKSEISTRFLNNGQLLRLQNGRLMAAFNWNKRVADGIDIGERADLALRFQNRINGGTLEPSLVELKDGRIWMLMRTITGYLWESFSEDGGLSWSEPAPTHVTCGGPVYVTRLTSGRTAMIWNRANWANADTWGYPHGFDTSFVALSGDEGKTWPVKKLLYPGSFAYSVPTVLPDGTLGCLFETEGANRIVFAHFSLEWLPDGKDWLNQPR